ncbi:MAG: hypothetical protein AB7O78_19355 [Thermoleophilia bacterium]
MVALAAAAALARSSAQGDLTATFVRVHAAEVVGAARRTAESLPPGRIRRADPGGPDLAKRHRHDVIPGTGSSASGRGSWCATARAGPPEVGAGAHRPADS